jgi:hypothetical protein
MLRFTTVDAAGVKSRAIAVLPVFRRGALSLLLQGQLKTNPHGADDTGREQNRHGQDHDRDPRKEAYV